MTVRSIPRYLGACIIVVLSATYDDDLAFTVNYVNNECGAITNTGTRVTLLVPFVIRSALS